MAPGLTRTDLDRLAVNNGGRVGIRCKRHLEAGTNALYQDGDLRLLCSDCGFEVVRIKVATEGSPAGNPAMGQVGIF